MRIARIAMALAVGLGLAACNPIAVEFGDGRPNLLCYETHTTFEATYYSCEEQV